MKEQGNCIITLPYDVSAPLGQMLADPKLLTKSMGGAYDTLVGVFAGASILNGDKLPKHELVDPYAKGLKQTIYDINADLAHRRTNPRGRVRAGALLKAASAVYTAHARGIPEITIFTPSAA